MKPEVNWLQMLVFLTILLLVTFSILEADLLPIKLSGENTGKITFNIVEKPKSLSENAIIQKET